MSSFMGSLVSLSSRISAETTATSSTARQLCHNDPKTVRGRLNLCLLLFCVPSWPAIVSIIVTTVRLVPIAQQFITINQVLEDSYKLEKLGDLIAALQDERNALFVLTATNDSARDFLTNMYAKSDSTLSATDYWPIVTNSSTLYKNQFASALNTTREAFLEAEEINRTRLYEWYSTIIESFMGELPPMPDMTISSSYFNSYQGISESLYERQLLSGLCLHGVQYFIDGFLNQPNRREFLQLMFILSGVIDDRPDAIGKTYKKVASSSNISQNDMNQDIWGVFDNISLISLTEPSPEKARLLYDSCSVQLTHRHNAIISILSTMREDEIKPKWNNELYMLVFFLAILVIQIPAVMFLSHSALTSTETISNFVSIFVGRTKELKAEQRRSELLLQEMLPKSIAKQLKLGRHVHAMQYEAVSVYFSDVTDFTEVSSMIEPFQIVTLLNSIYNFMDSKLELYDVYKVETIGSTYMVASGLPVKNEDRHVSEVAGLALDILEAVNDYVIPHVNADRKLSLRIGAHTGPVVAGVVGNKAPRYCLFGDTVNTASRMQSTGEAHRVHISGSMKAALDKIGGYITEHRGCINVKGKGTMNTYWLNSKVLFRSRSRAQVTMMVQEKEGLLMYEL